MPALQSLPDLTNADQAAPYINSALMNQVGLANQFNAAGAERNAADLQGINLQNQFDQQNMATKLGQSQATLADTIAGTQGKEFTNRINAGTEQEQMAAKRAEMLQKASTAELTALSDKGQRLIYQGAESGDQSLIDKGNRMMSASWEAQQTKQKQEAELAKAKEMGIGRLNAVNAQQTGANEREQKAIEAGKYQKQQKQQGAQDIVSQVQVGKLTYEKAGTAFGTMAMVEQDPEIKAGYTEAANYFNSLAAQKAANLGGKPDLGELGVKTNPTYQAPPMPSFLKPAAPAAPASAPERQVAPTTQDARDTDRVAILQAELAKATSPEDRAALTRELQRAGVTVSAPAAKQAPPVPAGKVLMYSADGKAGYVPEGQKDAALAQGYKLTK